MSQAPLISVIDDDEAVRTSLEALILSLGHAVATFDSAAAFLGSEAVDSSACVISDVHMPGMTGLDLKTALNDRGVRTPVILITAIDDGRARQRGLDLGASCFLMKPFTGSALIACVEAALARGAAA